MSAGRGNKPRDTLDVIRETGSEPVSLYEKLELPEDWRPSASFAVMRRRAELLAQIRVFMEERSIMEVDTPILDSAANPDPSIESLECSLRFPNSPGTKTVFLHTSPEFSMKRLLAAGSGPIYQICKVFRDNETGHYHQPEFTMLEWYRPGFDHHGLMDEIGRLLEYLQLKYPDKKPYAVVFNEFTGLDPHAADLHELNNRAMEFGLSEKSGDRSLLLDLIFSHGVAPNLGQERPLFVYDFPSCQAALAQIRTGPPDLAQRFELFINGIEIANGYNELNDILEQYSRFKEDNVRRRVAGLKELPVDMRLLAALHHGLPSCAGVAMGLDRLLMILTGSRSLSDVLSYPVHSGN